MPIPRDPDLPQGANPTQNNSPTIAELSADLSEANDWRVGLDVPSQIADSPVLAPFNNTSGRMIFPFTPTIFLSQRANYNTVDLTHSNYPFYAYQNSQIDDITITGTFAVENDDDAKYWVAVLHFLRTMTKMFYGESNPLGNPPLLTRLSGYGEYVLNKIPVLITNFSVDLAEDVDYRQIDIEGNINYVPLLSTIVVTCTPNYARRSHAKFDLTKFANGGFVDKPEGFV